MISLIVLLWACGTVSVISIGAMIDGYVMVSSVLLSVLLAFLAPAFLTVFIVHCIPDDAFQRILWRRK
jgi:hypothetical protein